ncbi:MAG: PIG-L deacetylase family protein [Candidatus Binatia bacterium]
MLTRFEIPRRRTGPGSGRLILRAVTVAAVAWLLATPRTGAAQPTILDVNAGERLVVVAPHPDDETLGAGGLIQRVLARGGTVRVVLITAGDGYVEAVVHETGRLRPRPAEYVAYGERRLREARSAFRELDGETIRAEHLLGFPDGGIEPLLTAHRQRTHPEQSSTTGASAPPYSETEHPDVRYDGDDLRAALARCFREVQPTIIAFPDPLDRHPDHRATGSFTLLAVKDLTEGHGRSQPAAPRLLAYLVHWPDWPPGWDAATPSALMSDAALTLPSNLPARDLERFALALTDTEIAAKRRALARYASQQEVMPSLLAAFVRRTEPFTVFTGTK